MGACENRMDAHDIEMGARENEIGVRAREDKMGV
jgi:hypothetical protein